MAKKSAPLKSAFKGSNIKTMGKAPTRPSAKPLLGKSKPKK